MTTVTKTFAFASGAEGFADRGGALTGAYDGADGSPSNGCYAFSGDPSGADGGLANLTTTWEGLGVWPGATVTAAECTAYKINSDNAAYLECSIAITATSGTAIMPAPLVNSAGTIVGPTGWIAGDSLGGAQTLTASQASSTAIKMQLAIYSENSGASTFKFDAITLSLTFTGGTDPVRMSADRMSNRAYTRNWRRGETG